MVSCTPVLGVVSGKIELLTLYKKIPLILCRLLRGFFWGFMGGGDELEGDY